MIGAAIKSLAITIVDVIGVFFPGLLFVTAVAILLGTGSPAAGFVPLDIAARLPQWLQISGLIVVVYVLGFLMRLGSLRALQRLTSPFWEPPLTRAAGRLEQTMRACIGDSGLSEALVEMGRRREYRSDVAASAPFFHFAKRIVRLRAPRLWPEAQRLEAEIRFAAGLLVPLLLFAIDAAVVPGPLLFRLLVLGVSLGGIAVIVTTFPSKRIREVINIHFLAIIALRYKDVRQEKRALKSALGSSTEEVPLSGVQVEESMQC